MEFHEKIKAYIVDHGIKQTFLAQKIGLTDYAFSDVLSGQRKLNAIEYYKLCQALGVPMEYFIEEER